jgi:hypothetical protein
MVTRGGAKQQYTVPTEAAVADLERQQAAN